MDGAGGERGGGFVAVAWISNSGINNSGCNSCRCNKQWRRMVMARLGLVSVPAASRNNDSVCFNSASCGRGAAYCYASSDGNRNAVIMMALVKGADSLNSR